MTPVLPLGHEPVESPSALSSGPKGLKVERLKVEWRFRVINGRNVNLSMEMSFFTMPLAQTWHAWIWFRTPDTIVFTNHDHVHVLSRQGRPHKDRPVGPFKPAPFDKLMVLSKVEGHTDKGPRRQ
jgi:hypothetical protein